MNEFIAYVLAEVKAAARLFRVEGVRTRGM